MKTVVENVKLNNLRICSVEGCKNKIFGRGYCGKHYSRWRRHDDPLKGGTFRRINKKPPKLKCFIEDCNKPRIKQNFCVMHYERNRRHGSPFTVKTRTDCKIEGCNGKHNSLGYCEFHYERLKNGTPLTQEKRIVDKTRGCSVLNCSNPHWGRYYCKMHYMKFLTFRQSRRKDDPELEFIMNLVRRRDNNTCKWQNCGKTSKETSIHVHHIFPQSEYPELKYREDYMICYCKKHHKKWHKSRGDKYYKWF